jgi:hypothetical protein
MCPYGHFLGRPPIHALNIGSEPTIQYERGKAIKWLVFHGHNNIFRVQFHPPLGVIGGSLNPPLGNASRWGPVCVAAIVDSGIKSPIDAVRGLQRSETCSIEDWTIIVTVKNNGSMAQDTKTPWILGSMAQDTGTPGDLARWPKTRGPLGDWTRWL